MTALVSVASPEVGWSISCYIPYVRAIAKNYDHVLVWCHPDLAYLYADFATEIAPYTPKGKPDRWLEDYKKHTKPPKWLRKKYPEVKFVVPTKSRCLSKKKKFKMYGAPISIGELDLLIHARAVKRYKGDKRNHGPEWYSKLLSALPRGLRAASIGTKAHYVPGTEDLRGIPLEALCNHMAGAKLVIGPSSGPMHLASHCGCPHIVWTTDKFQKSIGGTNKDRYKKLWNPFNTKVKVIDKYGWKPPVDVISEKVRKMLCA